MTLTQSKTNFHYSLLMDSDQGLYLDKATLGDLSFSFSCHGSSSILLPNNHITGFLHSFILPLLLGIPLFPQH